MISELCSLPNEVWYYYVNVIISGKNNYYKLDQFGGLLKFLKKLFRE